MSREKRCRGHFCWSCESILPNEKFSGSGHARHVCKACSKLGPEELAFRQAVRDIDSCLGESGAIRRKRRSAFNKFLAHENPRVRAYAQELADRDERIRKAWQQERENEDALEELWEVLFPPWFPEEPELEDAWIESVRQDPFCGYQTEVDEPADAADMKIDSASPADQGDPPGDAEGWFEAVANDATLGAMESDAPPARLSAGEFWGFDRSEDGDVYWDDDAEPS